MLAIVSLIPRQGQVFGAKFFYGKLSFLKYARSTPGESLAGPVPVIRYLLTAGGMGITACTSAGQRQCPYSTASLETKLLVYQVVALRGAEGPPFPPCPFTS